jgi:hypothetical protein
MEVPSHWRPEIEECLLEKCLSDSARNEIVRTLVNLMFARMKKPARQNCEDFARKLIMKYPFLMGNGYVSQFLLYMIPSWTQ